VLLAAERSHAADPAMTAIERYHRDESGELAPISEDAVSEEREDQLARFAA